MAENIMMVFRFEWTFCNQAILSYLLAGLDLLHFCLSAVL